MPALPRQLSFVVIPVLLPVAFLAAQYAAVAGLPAMAKPAAYIAMLIAPLFAAVACVWRGRLEGSSGRDAWRALALSLGIWSLGALGNLWQEWVLGRTNEMYREAMLAFDLAAVPIAFVLASEWHATGRRWVRIIDGALATALGYAFFLAVWSILTAPGTPGQPGVAVLIWMLDAQNLFLALGAFVRWHAAGDRAERDLFRASSTYLTAYLVLIFWNNHFVAGDPAFGPEQSSVITIAFAICAGSALWPLRSAPMIPPGAEWVRAVRIASPIVLAGALLIVSLFMIRIDYTLGAAGVLVAVLGYAARTTLSQMRQMQRRDLLRQERSALQAIAWTDALTGVANRRFLDHVLAQAARRSVRVGQPMSALMIDIDHFKQFNDRFGHPAGDACLRAVAQELQRTLARPGDVLARYGGEEFIALLHDADIAGARIVAERLRAAVQAHGIVHPDSPDAVVTISIGAASVLQADAVAANRMVEAADRALYEAKRAGRNRVTG